MLIIGLEERSSTGRHEEGILRKYLVAKELTFQKIKLKQLHLDYIYITPHCDPGFQKVEDT